MSIRETDVAGIISILSEYKTAILNEYKTIIKKNKIELIHLVYYQFLGLLRIKKFHLCIYIVVVFDNYNILYIKLQYLG